MSSKSTSSNNSTTASTPGTNFGNIPSKSDEDAALTAIGDNGSGEEPAVKTGNDGLESSSENRQAIQGLLVSQQKVIPNQSARALIKGNVGSVIASLIDFREDPGASGAISTVYLFIGISGMKHRSALC